MKQKCLLIPGNPAIAERYLSWISELEARNSALDITYSSSYISFSRRLDASEYDRAMFEHHEKSLLALSGPDEKITIIAHSVGAYFGLRLLEKYPDRIKKVIALFPYIGYDRIRLLKFVRIPYLIDRIFPLVEAMSCCKAIFERWIKEAKHISSKNLATCLRFGVRQCTYFRTHKLNVTRISEQKDKIYFFYTDRDKWCPEETIQTLLPISHGKKTELPHDFIMTEAGKKGMTEEMADCF